MCLFVLKEGGASEMHVLSYHPLTGNLLCYFSACSLNRLTLYKGSFIGFGVAFPLLMDSSDYSTIFIICEILPLKLKELYLQKREALQLLL